MNKRKKEIFINAKKLFMKYGYEKTTMNDIAKSINKSKASLYYYYKDKNTILNDIINSEFIYAKNKLLKSISINGNAIEKLHQYIITRIKLLNRFALYYSTFSEDYLRQFSFIEKSRKSFDREELNLICKLLQEGIDDGLFSINNKEDLAEAFLIVLKGYEWKWAKKKINKKFLHQIYSLFDVLLNGIVKDKKND